MSITMDAGGERPPSGRDAPASLYLRLQQQHFSLDDTARDLKAPPSIPETSKFVTPITVFSAAIDKSRAQTGQAQTHADLITRDLSMQYPCTSRVGSAPVSPTTLLFSRRSPSHVQSPSAPPSTPPSPSPPELDMSGVSTLRRGSQPAYCFSASPSPTAMHQGKGHCPDTSHVLATPVQMTRPGLRARSLSDCSENLRRSTMLLTPSSVTARISPPGSPVEPSSRASTSLHTSPITPKGLDAAPENADPQALVFPRNVGHTDFRSNSRNDFSAYVSGLGQPVDPDIELSSVVQLQAFRMQSRSRSVGPGYQRSGRLTARDGQRGPMGWRRYTGTHPALASPPRPPLSLAQAAEPDSELPPAVAEVPKPTHATADLDVSPPPRPEAARGSGLDVPSLETQDEAKPDSGSHVSPPRGELEKSLRRQRASRPRAEDPEPLDLSAFADREQDGDDTTAEMSEDRGRSRGRSLQRGRPALSATEWPSAAQTKTSPSRPKLARTNSAGSRIGLSGSHRGVTNSKRGGSSHRRSPGCPAPVRGRDPSVSRSLDPAKAKSSDDLPPLARSASHSVPSPTIPPGEEEVNGFSRARLLSNGSHLLMLSLEIAMIRNNKINAPLKPRWGKRRDDDFRPIPPHPIVSASRARADEQMHFKPPGLAMTCAVPACLRGGLRPASGTETPTDEEDAGGSPLKHAWP